MRKKGQELNGEESAAVRDEYKRQAREEVNRALGLYNDNPTTYPSLPASHWFAQAHYWIKGDSVARRVGSQWNRGQVLIGEREDALIRSDAFLRSKQIHALMWCMLPNTPNRVASSRWAESVFRELMQKDDYRARFAGYKWEALLSAVFTFHTGELISWVTEENERQYRCRTAHKLGFVAA
jgi:hypothetical protein